MYLIKMLKIKRILCCNEENGRYFKKIMIMFLYVIIIMFKFVYNLMKY